MKLLAIETSTGVGSVAVRDGDTSDAVAFPEGTRHGTALVPSIEDLLGKAGWDPADLDAVAVSIGPGSYTGLRVGLVCATMMAVYAGADLVAVPSLDVIARNADTQYGDVCAVVDARRNQVYAAVYERFGESIRRVSGYAVVAPEELLGTLRENTCCVGDGVPVIQPEVGGRSLHLAPEDQWVPHAETVAVLGAQLHTQGVRNDPRLTEPLYLRKPAAEEQWAKRETMSG